MKKLLFLFVFGSPFFALCQSDSANYKQFLDSSYIAEVQDKKQPDKVLHAEPLYIDLIRDLGARKGEKEWNIGLGLSDRNRHDLYEALVEYEFAPLDRLGLEVELPFSFHSRLNGTPADSVPGNRLNSVKLAAQYTFFVSEKHQTSMAIGYIHEFEFAALRHYGKSNLLTGHVYNPFFVAARRWRNNFHTLLYTGPVLVHHKGHHTQRRWQANTNVHYMIQGTRNFIGVEFNNDISKKNYDMTIRPQMRVGIADNLLVGIVVGIPIVREQERLSSFIRLIYEPGHKHRPKTT